MLKKLKTKTRLFILSFFILLALLALSAISLYIEFSSNSKSQSTLEQTMREEYDYDARRQVSSLIALLEGINKHYENKEITLADAKKLGSDLIRNMQYSEFSYFWVDINNVDTIVSSGSEAESTNRIAHVDVNGVPMIKQIIENGMQPDGGFTDYLLPDSGETEAYTKRIYSKYFEPFDWTVGTANYIDDIYKEVYELSVIQRQKGTTPIIIFLTLLVLLSLMCLIAAAFISINITTMILKKVGLK